MNAIWRMITRLLRRRVALEPALPRIGRPRLTLDDTGDVRCTACSLCSVACPSHCIRIVPGPRGEAHLGLRMAQAFEIDLARCVLCGLCVEACPVDAIRQDGELLPHASGPHQMRLDLDALTTT